MAAMRRYVVLVVVTVDDDGCSFFSFFSPSHTVCDWRTTTDSTGVVLHIAVSLSVESLYGTVC